MKINPNFTCSVCGKTIIYPNFRIEWGCIKKPTIPNNIVFDFIQACHDDCSYGSRSGTDHPITFGDIIFTQDSYTTEQLDQRLNELSFQYPQLRTSIEEIKANLFSQ